jgi:hypothetical protein
MEIKPTSKHQQIVHENGASSDGFMQRKILVHLFLNNDMEICGLVAVMHPLMKIIFPTVR